MSVCGMIEDFEAELKALQGLTDKRCTNFRVERLIVLRIKYLKANLKELRRI